MQKKPNLQLFIIDDDADDREFLKDALIGNGYEFDFVEFDNGAHLFEYLLLNSEKIPDLILLDLNMPVKNGYETLKELKMNELLKAIPVMVITSSSRSEDEIYCYQLGCDHFCRKPITLNEYEKLTRLIVSYSI